ncbi:MAG TPA: hypothetical protein PLK12_16035 [Prolixibacteraceae bacterium]|nr:hypothetical protein [Prolixibacteraceae bacterium]
MDQKQTIEAWAGYVIERWELEILRLGINQTGQLLKSFTHTIITQSGGNVEKIIFAFEFLRHKPSLLKKFQKNFLLW